MYRVRRKISVSRQLFSRVGTWLAGRMFVATKFSISPLKCLRKVGLPTRPVHSRACIGCVGKSACAVNFFRESAPGSPGKVFVATKFSVSPPTNLRKISPLTSASLVKARSGASENQRVSATCQNVKVKVKFSHTRYRALGPELIPVYRQSARR